MTPESPFFAIVASYLLAALTYEQCRQRCSTVGPQGQPQPRTQEQLPSPGPTPKPRYREWDFVKFVCQVLIVGIHSFPGHWSYNWQYPYRVIAHWPTIFKMNTLVFMSGVMGYSIEWDSMSKMLCYTLGTMTLFKAVNLLEWYFWYMWVLFTCRMTISPAFAWCKQRDVPVVVPLVATILVSYMMTYFDYEARGELVSWVQEANFFAPYFALGLCLPLKKWHALMQDNRVAVLCATVLVLFTGSLFHSRRFQEWADGACALHMQCTRSCHYPDSVHPPLEMGWVTFSAWVRVFCQRAVGGCAVFCVLGRSVLPLSYVLPMDSICALGSRTVYSYIFNQQVMRVAQCFNAFRVLESVPGTWWILACITWSVTIAVALTSSLTERLLQWIVLPYWMLDVPRVAMNLWRDPLALARNAGRAVYTNLPNSPAECELTVGPGVSGTRAV